MKFRPLHDRVVVKRIDAEEKSAGGIIIPDTAKEKPSQGEVIAVGPGGRDESGKLIPIDVKVGDRVLFGKWSGTEVKIDGQELLIMKESDIMGVIDEPLAKKKAAQRIHAASLVVLCGSRPRRSRRDDDKRYRRDITWLPRKSDFRSMHAIECCTGSTRSPTRYA
jgi:chaperonin GroES